MKKLCLALAYIMLSASLSFAATESDCVAETLKSGTIEGVYTGLECEGACIATFTLDDKSSFLLLMHQDEAARHFGETTGQRASVGYEVRRTWIESKQLCANLPWTTSVAVLDAAATQPPEADAAGSALEREIQDLQQKIAPLEAEKRKNERRTAELEPKVKALRDERPAVRQQYDQLSKEDSAAVSTRLEDQEPREVTQKRRAELSRLAGILNGLSAEESRLNRELDALRDDRQRTKYELDALQTNLEYKKQQAAWHAERKRLAQEQARQQEAERKAEAERLAQQEIERQAAAEEEARRQEAERKAEAERLAQWEAERPAREEAQRQAEAERRAEAEREARLPWILGILALIALVLDFLYIKDIVNPFRPGLTDVVISCLWVSGCAVAWIGPEAPWKFWAALAAAAGGTVYTIVMAYKHPYSFSFNSDSITLRDGTSVLDFVRTFVLKTVFALAISLTVVVVAIIGFVVLAMSDSAKKKHVIIDGEVYERRS